MMRASHSSYWSLSGGRRASISLKSWNAYSASGRGLRGAKQRLDFAVSRGSRNPTVKPVNAERDGQTLAMYRRFDVLTGSERSFDVRTDRDCRSEKHKVQGFSRRRRTDESDLCCRSWKTRSEN